MNDQWYQVADLRSAFRGIAGTAVVGAGDPNIRLSARNRVNGTSPAAAQIAGLAGLMWQRFPATGPNSTPANTPANLGAHIRRLTRKTGTTAADYTVGGVGHWSISYTPNPTIKVPDVADFHKALTDLLIP